MPTLKQISCSLELGSSTRLKEYDHRYTDGGVEAFVAVPDTQIPFHIRVTSSGYIAPGLAVYVFMDGAYQCNRNRQRLAIPGPGTNTSEYEVDFKLRQKEEKTSEGLFVAREWTFAQLKTGNADRAPNVNPSFASNVGTIEVVVLRCKEGGAREDAVDPAHAVVEVGPSKKLQSRVASAVNAAPAARPASVVKAPSRVSKTPSAAKAPSKAPSKAASEVGGLFGLFDGACDGEFDTGFDGAQDFDKHGYPIRPSSNIVTRPPPPEYRWDELRGAYRHVPPFDRTPDLASRGYDEEFTSVDVQPRHSVPPEDIPLGGRGDIVFIQESAKEIQQLFAKGTEHAEKYTVMNREATMHRNDLEVFPAMARALQRKYAEIKATNQDIIDLYHAISACIRRMDNHEFQEMERFLYQQKVWPEMQLKLTTPPPTPTTTSRRVSLQSPRPRTTSRVQLTPVKDEWQDIGSGKTRPSLAERKQGGYSRGDAGRRERSASVDHRRNSDRRRRSSSVDRRRDFDRRRRSPIRSRASNEDMDGVSKWAGGLDDVRHNDPWETTSFKKSSRNDDADGWGNTPAKSSSRKKSAWDDSPVRNSPKSDAGWANATGSVKSSHRLQKSGGWAADNATPSKVPGAWDTSPNEGDESWLQQGQDAGAGGDDAWGNNDNGNEQDESKSDNDAGGWGANDDAAGGWDDQDAAEPEKKDDANDGWGTTGGNDAKPDDTWDTPAADGSKKSDGWGGANDPFNSKLSSRKQSSAKPASEAGWGKPASNNNGAAGAWDNDPKASSAAKSAHEKAKSRTAPRTFGHDGANSHTSRTSTATEVSALRPIIKPYWQLWSKSPEKEKTPRAQPRDAYVYPAPPTIVAPSSGKPPSVSHGIQAGRGAAYMHKLHQPEYLDSMESPYAIFTFKYRSQGAVERILKKKIDMGHVREAVREVEESRLMRLPKDELVAEVMRRGEQQIVRGGAKTDSHASKLRGEWEKKAASRAGSGSKAPSKVASGWNNAEVKPSDSVSNVAASRASSKKKVDDWQQIGTGDAAAGGWGNGSKVSKAKTEQHWGADDPEMKSKKVGGNTVW